MELSISIRKRDLPRLTSWLSLGILKTRKIGHTGTLDPDAEGVLPVCVGKATKICELLTDKTKEYEAVMLLGRTTDTQDVTGETLTQQEVRWCKGSGKSGSLVCRRLYAGAADVFCLKG